MNPELAITLAGTGTATASSWLLLHRSKGASHRRALALAACSMVGLLASCSDTTNATGSTTATTVVAAEVASGAASEAAASGSTDDAAPSSFSLSASTHADTDDGDYETTGATAIALADGASTVDGAGASVDGDTVTITAAGTYVLSGSLTDGQVVVNSTGDGKVELVLDGVDIASSTTSPVVVTAADEAVVVLADGSVNTLADSAASSADDETEDAPTATLFSMADLTIAGSGALDVTGASNDAISSKDGLVILSGTIAVDAVDDGIRGKDYLVVEGGDITVTAGGDGLKSDNDTAGELGWIQLDSGTITISAGSQGADAVGAIAINDGTMNVVNSEEGLQAATITVAGGAVDVTASDDGLNATAHTVEGGGEAAEEGVLATISGGTVIIAAGSDGIDSNGSATITGGTVGIATQGGEGGGGNGALDVNGTLTAPGVITIDASDIEAGQRVTIADSDGNTVGSLLANSTSTSLVVTAAGITSGDAYTVYAGDSSSTTSLDGLTAIGTVTATDASQAATGGGGGRPGRGPGG